MLQSQKSNRDTSLKSNRRQATGLNDLDQLRKLLLGSEYHELLELQREFSDHSHTSKKISEVISEAIALRSKQDNSLTYALAPSVEEAIHSSVKRNPRRLANALFPVIGPAIRESVAETVSSMMQQVNQALENSFSIRSIKWRIDALRTDRTFAEVMLSETVLYQVEQVFLIHRESGLLINHLTSKEAIVKDPDMVSGMLTAVTDFVKDSFVVDKQQNVKSIKFGQLNLLFEAGPYAILVAAVRGITPPDLQITLREQIEELHRLYSMQLETYDGEAQQFPDTYPQLNRCLLRKSIKESSDNQSNIPWAAIVTLSLLLLLPLAWLIFQKIEQSSEQSQWNSIVQEFQQEPGVVILDYQKRDGGYIVRGLRDSLSRDPHEISSAIQEFEHPITWKWQSYFSNEKNIVLQRINKVIEPPPTVNIDYDRGKLILSGKADSNWIAELSAKLPYVWGVQEIDSSGLKSKLDFELKLRQFIGSLESIVLEYQPNVYELKPNQYKKLSEVAELISGINEVAEMKNVQLKIGILGFADKTGITTVNRELSERRARTVHDALLKFGVPEDLMLAQGLGEFGSRARVAKSASCVHQRCVIFEAYPNRF